MKESYLAELYKIHQQIALKVQQQEILVPPEKMSEEFEKQRKYVKLLEHIIQFLLISKKDVLTVWKEKLPIYERQIVNLLVQNRNRKLAPAQPPALQQFRHPSGHASSPIAGESEKLTESTIPDGNQADTCTSVPSKSITTQDLFDHLIKWMENMPHKALSSGVPNIKSAVTTMDCLAGSAPGNTSRASMGQEFATMTKCSLQSQNITSQDGNTTTMKNKRHIIVSCGQVASELESPAKRQKGEANHALVEEISETNQKLFYTVASIMDKDDDSVTTLTSRGGGTMVKLSFSLDILSPIFRSKFISGQLSPIVPLRLLVPDDYPKCSPIIIDKLQLEASHESEVLSVKVQSIYDRSIRSLVQPVSLREMATMWHKSICKAITEYAEQNDGSSFSSRYGVWESCVPD